MSIKAENVNTPFIEFEPTMPTVMRADGLRFFFYSTDRSEPPHIHVRSGKGTAKIWLAPMRLERSRKLLETELRRILKLVRENRRMFVRSWNAYFHHSA